MARPGLFYKVEAAISAVEEISAAADRWVARRISDDLLPALLEARTYVEVGQLAAPEIRLALARAAVVAGEIADADPAYAPLHSRVRVLIEDAGSASAARSQRGTRN
jgi:hypothetical protein